MGDELQPKKSSAPKWVLGGCLGCFGLSVLVIALVVYRNLDAIKEGYRAVQEELAPLTDIQAALDEELGLVQAEVQLQARNNERHLKVDLQGPGTSGLEGEDLARRVAELVAARHPNAAAFKSVQVALTSAQGALGVRLESSRTHTFPMEELLEAVAAGEGEPGDDR